MIGSKVWLALFLLYLLVTILCLATEGSYIGAEQTTHLSQLASLDVSFGSIGTIWNIVTDCFTWHFAVLETGIGVYIKLVLMCLSAAVAIPFVIDLARVILKPFGG